MIVPMISLVAVLHLVSSSSLPPSAGEGGGQAMALKVQSSAFTEGSTIPAKHTCDGADVSPAVSWFGVPAEAKSLALICHDPDAPAGDWTFHHLVRCAEFTVFSSQRGYGPVALSGGWEIAVGAGV